MFGAPVDIPQGFPQGLPQGYPQDPPQDTPQGVAQGNPPAFVPPRPKKNRGRRGGRNNRKNKLSISSGATHRMSGSQQYYQGEQQATWTNAQTWKSDTVREREEYYKVRHHVKHVAPEQFKWYARPSNEPSEIFPQDPVQWHNFKAERHQARQAELADGIAKMKDRVAGLEKVPREKRDIKSRFGGEDGKVFGDGLGPVLAQPTIWSAEYGVSDYLKAQWPSQAELLWNGDARGNNWTRTHDGRCLPMPRACAGASTSFHDQPVVAQFPLDQTGLLYFNGPDPTEVLNNNFFMNIDSEFERKGNAMLGSELMEEIGEHRPPFIPDWQLNQRAETYGNMIQWDRMGTGMNRNGPWVPGLETVIEERSSHGVDNNMNAGTGLDHGDGMGHGTGVEIEGGMQCQYNTGLEYPNNDDMQYHDNGGTREGTQYKDGGIMFGGTWYPAPPGMNAAGLQGMH